VARALAFATSAAIAVTGLQGLITGDTTAISTVWAVTGPIVGALVSYYFGAHRKGFS
jgi:predicted membrane protein